jgi:hypothetical protein
MIVVTVYMYFQGKYLNSALRKEEFILTINGSICHIVELLVTTLRCNLSGIVHVKDIALPVKVICFISKLIWKRVSFSYVYNSMVICTKVVKLIFSLGNTFKG